MLFSVGPLARSCEGNHEYCSAWGPVPCSFEGNHECCSEQGPVACSCEGNHECCQNHCRVLLKKTENFLSVEPVACLQ